MSAFPWTEAWARQLHGTLTSAYQVADQIRFVTDMAGVPQHAIAWGRNASLIWHDVLDAATNRGVLQRLSEAILADPGIAAHHQRLRDLLVHVDALEPPGPGTAGPRPPKQTIVDGSMPGEPQPFVKRAAVERLEAAAEARPAVVCAVTGLRGVGKSHIAAAYARRRIDAGWSLVGWINADTSDRMLTDLATIARELHVHDPDGDSIESARRLRAHLLTRDQPGLLVFDNAADPDQVRTYLPMAGATSATQIVVTTTNHYFAELTGAIQIPVEKFGRPESIAYLDKRTALSDPSGADRVADALDDLPLALTQAAATIRRRSWTYSRYLDKLAATPVDRLLRRNAGQDYPLDTAKALLLAITTLEDDSPAGGVGTILRLIAVLSPDGVTEEILGPLRALLADDLDDLLETCVSGSVLTRSVDNEALLMHRLLARVLREHAAGLGELTNTIHQAATLLADQAVPHDQAWADRDHGANVVTQIEALWNNVGPEFDRPVVVQMLELRRWAVRHLYEVNDLARAVDLGKEVLMDHERVLGRNDPDALGARSDLASVYQRAGQLAESIPMHKQNLADRERVLGPDHPDTLTSRDYLASAYRLVGRLTEAAALYAQNLADRERVLGPDHPDTLTSRSNLAFNHRLAGRLRQAVGLFEQNLAARERIQGSDHPDTLTSRGYLAVAYQLDRRLLQAIEVFEQTLVDRERILGPDHPDTLNSRDQLATAYRLNGQVKEAVKLYESNLADREQVLGPDHPDTLTSRNNLAAAYRRAGRVDDALTLFEQSARDRERVLGNHARSTLTSRHDLAGAYRTAGQIGKSIDLYETNLANRKQVLGSAHPDTLTSQDALASTYQAQGLVEDAIALFEQNLSEREEALGPDHTDTLNSRQNLAGAYKSVGRMRDADTLLSRTLAERERLLGPDHKDTKNTRRALEQVRRWRSPQRRRSR